VDKLIKDDKIQHITQNIFGARARSEQRTIENHITHHYNYENKDKHFVKNQNKKNNEKKAREMLNSFMNK